MKTVKLSEGPPQTAHAMVSVAVMRKRLEALEAVADDPAKVKKWGERPGWNFKNARL